MAQRRHVLTRVSDETGAVLSGASAYVLRAGARVTTTQAISANSTATVKLRHPGALKLNDIVWVVRDDALLATTVAQYRVNSTPTYNSGVWDVTLLDLTGSDGGVQASDRLVLDYTDSDHYVTWYEDDTTTSGTSGVLSVSSVTGKVEFYVEQPDVDVAVAVSGTATYFTDIPVERRDCVYPQEFGAVADGSTDDSVAINNAVQFCIGQGGGTVYFQAGTYLVASEILVNDTFADVAGVFFRGDGINATNIVAGADNINVIHWAGNYGGIDSIGIDGNGYTGVSGLRLTPEDESQTSTRVDQDYNNFTNMRIEDCAEGIVLQCGPYVGSSVSGCYFNLFNGIYINRCTRGIWFKDGPNLNASGSNRNQFFGVRIGLSMNTGIQIDAGGTNSFFGCSLEEVATGTSPNTTPTGIKILFSAPVGGRGNGNNQFFGTAVEGCTRDLDIENVSTEFYGHSIAGSKINTAGSATIPYVMMSSQATTVPVAYKLQQYNNAINDEIGGGVPQIFVKGGTAPTSDAFYAPKGSIILHTNGKSYMKQSATTTDWKEIAFSADVLALSGGTMTGDIDMDGNNVTMGGGTLNMESGNITNVGTISGIGKHVNWSLVSRATGTYYVGGYYRHTSGADPFTITRTLGTANLAYGAHVYFVAASGATDTQITVTGTSITDGGTRTAADTEVVSLTNGAANTYYETTKKFIGQVSISRTAGTARSCNYGFAKYWDDFNTSFTISDLEATWLGGANDTGFNVELIHHKATGWTYNAGSTATPPTPLRSLQTVYNTEYQLGNGIPGALKVTGINQVVAGNDSEGIIWRVTTTAVNALNILNLELDYEEA